MEYISSIKIYFNTKIIGIHRKGKNIFYYNIVVIFYFLLIFIYSGYVQDEQETGQSILGIYEYVYDFNTESFIENHYLEFIQTNGKITGFYYGTSDDFDEAREGYLPGFFSAEMKNLTLTDSTISFEVQVRKSDFYVNPITPIEKPDHNIPWDIGIRYNKREYHGEVKNKQIILNTKGFDLRVFNKFVL